MKRFLLLIISAMLISSMASCSKTDETDESTDLDSLISATISGETVAETEFDYENNDISGMVTLGAYTGIDVTLASSELTEEELDAAIENVLSNYAYYEQITERNVEEGDTLVCDYSGYLDGVQFDGGTATSSRLTASSNSGYIDGFAEAFIGKTPGEEFSFNVTFPEEYGVESLNGQEVTFKATVSYICGEYVTPELTDEFVSENLGFGNVDEWKISYISTVTEQKEYYVLNQMYSELWATIVNNATVNSYPEGEVERIYSSTKDMYEAYATYYGTDYDTFMQSYVGMTDDELLEESRQYVKEDLVMYTLINELNVEVTDEEYAEELAFFSEYYGMSEDELISYYGDSAINKTILWQKMLEVVAPLNNIIEE